MLLVTWRDMLLTPTQFWMNIILLPLVRTVYLKGNVVFIRVAKWYVNRAAYGPLGHVEPEHQALACVPWPRTGAHIRMVSALSTEAGLLIYTRPNLPYLTPKPQWLTYPRASHLLPVGTP